MASPEIDADAVRTEVLARYGAAARAVLTGQRAGCGCGGTANQPCCGGERAAGVPIIDDYRSDDVDELPADAVLASLGCGNPTALAQLEPGQIVLDLGSGGGIDVLLSARRVGPAGFVYGLDMTDDMLALAERNRSAAGLTNVAFLKGTIEAIPLPNASVDVIISNCVINLSTDKAAVLREAERVLRPGGRFAVSDIVVQGALAPEVRASLESWAGCVAGALEEQQYRALLAAAGFRDIEVEVTGVHDIASTSCCGGASAPASQTSDAGRIVSAFVRARKP